MTMLVKILEDISSHIVNTHIDLTTAFEQPQDKAGAGTVYDYACEALGLGLLIMDFKTDRLRWPSMA